MTRSVGYLICFLIHSFLLKCHFMMPSVPWCVLDVTKGWCKCGYSLHRIYLLQFLHVPFLVFPLRYSVLAVFSSMPVQRMILLSEVSSSASQNVKYCKAKDKFIQQLSVICTVIYNKNFCYNIVVKIHSTMYLWNLFFII